MPKNNIASQYVDLQDSIKKQKEEKEEALRIQKEKEKNYDFWKVYPATDNTNNIRDEEFANALKIRESAKNYFRRCNRREDEELLITMYIQLRQSFGWKFFKKEHEYETYTTKEGTPLAFKYDRFYDQYQQVGGYKYVEHEKTYTWLVFYRDKAECTNYNRLLEIERKALDEFFAFVSFGYKKYRFKSYFFYGRDDWDDSIFFLVISILTFPISILTTILKGKVYRQYKKNIAALINQAKEEKLI